VYEFIIDGGSYTYVAFLTLIEKLQLRTKVHPTPYFLLWLKQRNEVTISKQALIAFSVGPYCSEVLCDVLPMNACHLLLSTPWSYGNHVIHDGHANTYAFKYIGRNLTLTLLSPPKLLKSKSGKGSEKSLFMSETRVERAISKSKPLFTLLMIESNISEGVKPMHPLGQPLLKEFEGVLPNDLPLGLLPLRGIEHQVDFLLGAPFPNKPVYRCNHNESKEFQRQV